MTTWLIPISETLTNLLSERQFDAARTQLLTLESVDIAALIEELPPELALPAYRLLPKTTAAETFSYLDSDTQESLLRLFTNREMADVMSGLYDDDAADAYGHKVDHLVYALQRAVAQRLVFGRHVVQRAEHGVYEEHGHHREVYQAHLVQHVEQQRRVGEGHGQQGVPYDGRDEAPQRVQHLVVEQAVVPLGAGLADDGAQGRYYGHAEELCRPERYYQYYDQYGRGEERLLECVAEARAVDEPRYGLLEEFHFVWCVFPPRPSWPPQGQRYSFRAFRASAVPYAGAGGNEKTGLHPFGRRPVAVCGAAAAVTRLSRAPARDGTWRRP